jgi:hypothetical protein
MLKRSLIFIHRWLGVALCVIFLLWFPSGIGMMYWRFPTVTPEDRLERSPKLDPSKVVLSPIEAAAKVGIQPEPAQVRLNTFDGRPVYRFGGRGQGNDVPRSSMPTPARSRLKSRSRCWIVPRRHGRVSR